jgi:hypothetical protein
VRRICRVIILILRVGIRYATTPVRARRILVAPSGVSLVPVDGRVGFVVRRHGEVGLVGIDARIAAEGELALVVAGEGAVEIPVLEGEEGDEEGGAPEETVFGGGPIC